MDCERLRAGLYAYLDGELDVKDTIEIEQHIGECPMCSALVRYEERFRRQVLKMIKREPAPEALKERIQNELDACSVSVLFKLKKVFSWPGMKLAAATVVASAVVVFITSLVQDTAQVEARQLADSAVKAHLEYLDKRLEPEFRCTGLTPMTEKWTELNKWFQGRLPFAVEPPVIDFEPVGGRIHHLKGEPVAYFVCKCQRSNEKKLSLFVLNAEKVLIPEKEMFVFADKESVCMSTRGYTTVIWKENGLMFVAVGNVKSERMLTRLLAGPESSVVSVTPAG